MVSVNGVGIEFYLTLFEIKGRIAELFLYLCAT